MRPKKMRVTVTVDLKKKDVLTLQGSNLLATTPKGRVRAIAVVVAK